MVPFDPKATKVIRVLHRRGATASWKPDALEPFLRDVDGQRERTASISRNFGRFRQATTQPLMGNILVDARVPHGNHIETWHFDRGLEHD
jgi:hypothetical protein